MSSDYVKAGVDYDVLDAAKRAAIGAALSTSPPTAVRGVVGADASRGESAFLFNAQGMNLATVLECLGTKSTIARAYQEQYGVNRFDSIGYDTVAAIVNDIICVGALPAVVNAYFATGSPEWYSVDGRFEALVNGWSQACRDAGAIWGGGESPGLSGIVAATEIDLAGSAVGLVPKGVTPLLGNALEPGDEIVLVASTGLHANGASSVRKLVAELPEGYATRLDTGTTFGDAVLEPASIYVRLVEDLLQQSFPVTYLSHITGHGLRKLMRPNRDLTYRIFELPPVPAVLSFIVEQSGMTVGDAYGTFNMGAGFAVYCSSGSGMDVVKAARQLGFDALVAGTVEQGPRKVILEPADVSYTQEDLQLR